MEIRAMAARLCQKRGLELIAGRYPDVSRLATTVCGKVGGGSYLTELKGSDMELQVPRLPSAISYAERPRTDCHSTGPLMRRL